MSSSIEDVIKWLIKGSKSEHKYKKDEVIVRVKDLDFNGEAFGKILRRYLFNVNSLEDFLDVVESWVYDISPRNIETLLLKHL